jgi:hypothetical protein
MNATRICTLQGPAPILAAACPPYFSPLASLPNVSCRMLASLSSFHDHACSDLVEQHSFVLGSLDPLKE